MDAKLTLLGRDRPVLARVFAPIAIRDSALLGDSFDPLVLGATNTVGLGILVSDIRSGGFVAFITEARCRIAEQAIVAISASAFGSQTFVIAHGSGLALGAVRLVCGGRVGAPLTGEGQARGLLVGVVRG